jgi:hypothetical protein
MDGKPFGTGGYRWGTDGKRFGTGGAGPGAAARASDVAQPTVTRACAAVRMRGSPGGRLLLPLLVAGPSQ